MEIEKVPRDPKRVPGPAKAKREGPGELGKVLRQGSRLLGERVDSESPEAWATQKGA